MTIRDYFHRLHPHVVLHRFISQSRISSPAGRSGRQVYELVKKTHPWKLCWSETGKTCLSRLAFEKAIRRLELGYRPEVSIACTPLSTFVVAHAGGARIPSPPAALQCFIRVYKRDVYVQSRSSPYTTGSEPGHTWTHPRARRQSVRQWNNLSNTLINPHTSCHAYRLSTLLHYALGYVCQVSDVSNFTSRQVIKLFFFFFFSVRLVKRNHMGWFFQDSSFSMTLHYAQKAADFHKFPLLHYSVIARQPF